MRFSINITFLLLVLTTMLMPGCAGPNYGALSRQKETVVTSKPPENANLVINSRIKTVLITDGKGQLISMGSDSETKRIISALQKALVSTDKFQSVSISDVPTKDDLQLVVDFLSESRPGWNVRASSLNTNSSVKIAGKLQNFDTITLISFDKQRQSQGGLLGMGGLLTPDEDTMIDSLTERVTNDIADDIKAAFNN